MKKYARIFAVVFVMSSENVIAQELCVELANSIVYNQTRSYSSDEQHDISKADLCTEQYKHDASVTSLKVEASYKFFSGGLAGSQSQIAQEQSKRCEGKFGDFWRKSIKSESARTASAAALDVVKECLIMTDKGMKPKVKITDAGDNFTLTLGWYPSIPVELKLNYAGPHNFTGYQCSAQSGPGGGFRPVSSAAEVQTVVPVSGSFMLSCDRPKSTKTVDGETLTCYRETLINVATNGPSAVIKLPETCTPSMSGGRAAAIEQRIAALDNQLNQTRSIIDSMGLPTTANGHSCSVLGALQICWGSAVLTPNASAPHTASFSFTFPRKFAEVPSVTAYSGDRAHPFRSIAPTCA